MSKLSPQSSPQPTYGMLAGCLLMSMSLVIWLVQGLTLGVDEIWSLGLRMMPMVLLVTILLGLTDVLRLKLGEGVLVIFGFWAAGKWIGHLWLLTVMLVLALALAGKHRAVLLDGVRDLLHLPLWLAWVCVGIFVSVLGTRMSTMAVWTQVMNDTLGVDIYFHSGMAAMIGHLDVVSSGLHGTPAIAGHWLSHWMLFGISQWTGVPVLETYAVATPMLMQPLLMVTLIWTAIAMNESGLPRLRMVFISICGVLVLCFGGLLGKPFFDARDQLAQQSTLVSYVLLCCLMVDLFRPEERRYWSPLWWLPLIGFCKVSTVVIAGVICVAAWATLSGRKLRFGMIIIAGVCLTAGLLFATGWQVVAARLLNHQASNSGMALHELKGGFFSGALLIKVAELLQTGPELLFAPLKSLHGFVLYIVSFMVVVGWGWGSLGWMLMPSSRKFERRVLVLALLITTAVLMICLPFNWMMVRFPSAAVFALKVIFLAWFTGVSGKDYSRQIQHKPIQERVQKTGMLWWSVQVLLMGFSFALMRVAKVKSWLAVPVAITILILLIGWQRPAILHGWLLWLRGKACYLLGIAVVAFGPFLHWSMIEAMSVGILTLLLIDSIEKTSAWRLSKMHFFCYASALAVFVLSAQESFRLAETDMKKAVSKETVSTVGFLDVLDRLKAARPAPSANAVYVSKNKFQDYWQGIKANPGKFSYDIHILKRAFAISAISEHAALYAVPAVPAEYGATLMYGLEVYPVEAWLHPQEETQSILESKAHALGLKGLLILDPSLPVNEHLKQDTE
jgi:hypothetical protein